MVSVVAELTTARRIDRRDMSGRRNFTKNPNNLTTRCMRGTFVPIYGGSKLKAVILNTTIASARILNATIGGW
jgi:hypothetical protein